MLNPASGRTELNVEWLGYVKVGNEELMCSSDAVPYGVITQNLRGREMGNLVSCTNTDSRTGCPEAYFAVLFRSAGEICW